MTSASDLSIINSVILPAITGEEPFHPRQLTQVNMAYNELACFHALASSIRPEYCIEVGTENGATLSVLARHAGRVFSIDIDPGVRERLAPRFPNVEFLTGASDDLLAPLLRRIEDEKLPLEMIYIDGDHSEEAVRRDVEAVLDYRPLRRVFVLMHDTFNPECRRGIAGARWARSPYCHFVDLDFSPGVLHPDPAVQRQMWGGLGLAVLLPEPRTGDLTVKTSHQLTFDAAFARSVYAPAATPRGGALSRLLARLGL